MDWIREDQDRDKEWAVLNGIRNLRLPHGEGYFLRFRATAVLSRNILHGIATENNLTFVVQWKCAQILVPGRLNCLWCRPNICGPSGWNSFSVLL